MSDHPIRTFAAAALVVSLAFLAFTDTSRAANLTWTNATSDIWQSTTAWDGAPAYPGPGDNAVFTNAGAYTVTLVSDVLNLNSNYVAGSVGTQVLTLNLGTNSLSVVGNTTSPGPFYVGSQVAGATGIVYLSSSTDAGKGLFVTNSGNSARFVIGQKTLGQVFVTNGNVTANVLFMGSSTGGSGILVLSGSNTFWSNTGTVEMGNSSTSYGCQLVISNSASMTSSGPFKLGFGITASSGILLLDTGGRLFTTAAGTAIGGTPVSTNNMATVRGGATWDNDNKDFTVGASTAATNNTLTIIGTNSAVIDMSVAVISAKNTLNLQGGLLQATTVTNSGVLEGFGSLAGAAFITSGGLLTPGNGTTVGQIVFSNSLTLASGSTTLIKLNKSQASNNDSVNVIGSISYGGTLTVTNVGPALTGGDVFTVLPSGSQSGDFALTNLPVLNPSMYWDTSQLTTQGIIAVVFVPVPPGIVNLTNQAVTVGSAVTISATVTGIPTPTLQWQENGTNLVGDTGNSISIPNAQITNSGTYCLIASNIAGIVTNCMLLTVSSTNVPPTIAGPTDQIVVQGNNGTFTVSVSGLPTPTVQWMQNGSTISGATGLSLILTNVQYAQNGLLYSATASNVEGTATSTNATLIVYVPPSISTQPQSLVVTDGLSASFFVTASGVPTPSYQWYKNSVAISSGGNPTATNATFTIASTQPSDSATYSVIVSNAAGGATSSNATLTVIAGMTATLSPSNGMTGVCYDTPLYMNFTAPPLLRDFGKIRIYNVTNPTTPVDTLDMTQNFTNSNSAGSTTNIAINIQSRTIAGETFNTFPVIITGNTAAIYPHLDVLTSNQTYYVTIDPGVFTDTNGANFAGITSTNAWVFTTKPTGPANPTNLVVAADNSGDFLTVQGAVDSIPNDNTNHTLISIRNGTYTEIVDVHSKNNITFRGQTRAGTVVGYPNNYNVAPSGSTHYRMAFKVNGNDIAMENLTLVNMTPKGGSQAEALMIESAIKRFIFFNAEVDSFQDTILGNTSGTQAYFQNNLIQGDVDYIWGGMNAYFTNCELRTRTSPANLIQPRTDAISNGMAFVDCQLTTSSNSVTGITLARALGYADGNVVYANCLINCGAFTGWTSQDLTDNPTLRWWEYNNSNLTATAACTYNGTQLTNGDSRVALFSCATNWLYGWAPQLAPNITSQPVSMVVTAGQTAWFTVGGTGIPSPSYQWLKDGTNLIAATSATLTITNAQLGNAGMYSVVVSNVAGTIVSTNVALTVIVTPPVASFIANPTSGAAPLNVSFMDTSSNSPTGWSWTFGDGGTSTSENPSYTYMTPGAWTAQLIASNAGGSTTNMAVINVYDPFAWWQQQYFGTNTNPNTGPNADYTGTGMSNTNKFMAGFNPTNPAAYLHIISIARTNRTDVNVTYLGASGDTTYTGGPLSRTNVLEYTTGTANGSYTDNYASTGQTNILGGGTGLGTVTNMTDYGGAINGSSRYYRVRVLLP
ncbi:MAG TPA: pectinesterase family protein [Verrucomicrobiae bacterium]|nr:pectinesterase family protein [Verrucomicrobiae bacterium]